MGMSTHERIMARMYANAEGIPDGVELLGRMHSLLKPRFPTESDRPARINYLRLTFGRDIHSTKDLTVAEAVAFIDEMKGEPI
jgi:hypothetical protein